MLRVLFAAIVIALFPFIAQAEEKTIEQNAEVQAEEEGQVIVTVSIDKQSGEVKILIVNVKKENKKELSLPEHKEHISNKKHSRRRSK